MVELEPQHGRAGLDVNIKNALHDLGRIQRAPHYGAGITITMTTTPTKHQKDLLHAISAAISAAIGATIPERHTAA